MALRKKSPAEIALYTEGLVNETDVCLDESFKNVQKVKAVIQDVEKTIAQTKRVIEKAKEVL